jgi:hypothetical protein
MTTGGYRPSWARFRTAQCIESSSFRSLLVRHYRKDDWTNTLSCHDSIENAHGEKMGQKMSLGARHADTFPPKVIYARRSLKPWTS